MKRVLGLLAVLAIGSPLAVAQDNPKADACAASPTHACVLDLLWDQMARIPADYQPDTKRAFIDAALLTGDAALIALYKQRTGWVTDEALNSSAIKVARRRGDRATLVAHGDRAIDGRSYDWYQIGAIAQGLAETGEIERARKVADLIPHGADDSISTVNLYRNVEEVISFNDRAPITLRTWADRLALNDGWWDELDRAFLEGEAVRAAASANLDLVAQAVQDRFRNNGWNYLRALARLAPEMTAAGERSVQIFRGYVESWADPTNADIAEFVLMIAARATPDVRAAMLAVFDARQPTPPARIARIRAMANDPAADLVAADRGLLGMTGGSFEQRQAASAFATLTQDQFIAQARAGEGPFALSGPGVLRAALDLAPDEAYAHAIATLMAELGEPRTIDGYDYAQFATEWALDTCEADLFTLAESRLARRDGLDTMMWSARFDGEPVRVVQYIAGEDKLSSEVSSALSGYEKIIVKGYCPAN